MDINAVPHRTRLLALRLCSIRHGRPPVWLQPGITASSFAEKIGLFVARAAEPKELFLGCGYWHVDITTVCPSRSLVASSTRISPGRSNRYLRRKVRPVSGVALRSSWPRSSLGRASKWLAQQRCDHTWSTASSGKRHPCAPTTPWSPSAASRGGNVGDNHSLIWAIEGSAGALLLLGRAAGWRVYQGEQRQARRQTLRDGT